MIKKILTMVLVSVVLIPAFTSLISAAPFSSQTHIKAEITDMWIDGRKCVFKVNIISFDDDFIYFEPEDIYSNLTNINIGQELEVNCFFFDNSSEIRYGYGSNGYSIGDQIDCDLEFFSDEWSSFMYSFWNRNSCWNIYRE